MLDITFLQAGYCTHPEAMVIPGGSWKPISFPALFALIEHPIGFILFDTGYSDRFYQETQQFPEKIYRWITPVYLQPQESAVSQLQQQGIEPEAIKIIIISHFHADHIGGLKDFPNAQFICFQSAYHAVQNKQGFKALKAGFLSGLMPKNFEKRVQFINLKNSVKLPDELFPFEQGFDLLGDNSILGIELPGHVTGQLGLFLTDKTGQPYFLIADACWLSRAYQEFILPNSLTDLIVNDKQAYRDTLKKLNQLYKNNPNLKIIPSHCSGILSSSKNPF